MTRRALGLDDLFALRRVADPRLSPDGSTVAFVVAQADRDADADHNAIWSVDVDGGEPKPLTRGKADFSPRWSPDGRHLAFLRRDEDSPPQIWLLPTAGGEARKLTDLKLGAAGFVWSPDSSRLAVLGATDIEGEPESDEEKERRRHAPIVVRSAAMKSDGTGLIGTKRGRLHVVDVEDGQTQQLTKNDDTNVFMPTWFGDGRSIVFCATLEDRDVTSRTHLFVIDAAGGEPEEIAHWTGTALAPAVSPDDKSVLFVGQRSPAPMHSRLYSVPACGGEPVDVAPGFDLNVMLGFPAYPGALPSFLPDGSVVFCARDRGCTHVYLASDRQVTKIIGDDDRVVSSVTHAQGTLAYLVSAPEIPSDVFVSSVDGTGERRLTEFNSELLAEVTLHTPEPRTFTAPDGVEVHGWLIRGDGPSPQPLLLDIHGGPHNAWSPTFDDVHLYHEVLAAQGWSILRLNPRGSDGYGEDFYTAVVGKWGEIDEQDFMCAIDGLVVEGVVDPDRLAVCGYSYGGHMTNWLTARTDRFKAAVSGGSICDYRSFFGNSDVGYWLGSYELGAEPWENPQRYDELSPLTYVGGVKTPTLILHGEKDDRCPVGQAEQWFVALRRLGVSTELVRYPGGSHLFIISGRPSHRLDYNERIVDWLSSHV